MAEQPFPRCGLQTPELVPIAPGLKVALEAVGSGAGTAFVCKKCFTELTGQVSQGMRLRLEKEAQEKNKLMLWKNRVNLIKKARGLMEQKAYSEAAVTYEKYLRVLEMVYGLQKGQLSPAVFNNSTRSKELTVITSVYWDLVRIYDSSSRYGDRMGHAAMKLAQFLPLSPIYPDIVKKAEAFLRTARNPHTVRSFLKACKVGRGRCFIATAVFRSDEAFEVETLRQFRDSVLIPSPQGRQFVLWYYRHSPPIAAWVERHPWAQSSLKPFLRLLAFAAKKSLKSPASSVHS